MRWEKRVFPREFVKNITQEVYYLEPQRLSLGSSWKRVVCVFSFPVGPGFLNRSG